MKESKAEIVKAGSKVIHVFVEGLDSTPGWVALPYQKQQELVEHTDRVMRFRQMQRIGEFGEMVELTQVDQLLDGEDMQMKDYLRIVYPNHSQRTIARKQHAFQELSTTIPNSVLKRITALGEDTLSKFDRIAQAAIGDIRNALRVMPVLPVNTDKDAEKYLGELDAKLLEERKHRRAKGKKGKDEEYAAKMACNGVLHYVRGTNLKTSAEKRQWLKRVIGWVMEAQAVAGSFTASRIPIPDGIIIKRGRPPKNRKEAA